MSVGSEKLVHEEAYHARAGGDAAVQAARTRLRCVYPRRDTAGPGARAELRQALGTAVFFGMLGVTVFGLLFTPVFYVLVRWIGRRRAAGGLATNAPPPSL